MVMYARQDRGMLCYVICVILIFLFLGWFVDIIVIMVGYSYVYLLRALVV